MNQPQPGAYPPHQAPYPQQPYPPQPQRSGPNTALVVTLVVLVMTLIFVLVFFLFIQESDDAIPSATTTAAPATSPATTATSAPAATAPPTTALALAPCVTGEINPSTTGRRGEIALYQTTLKNLGFDPGEVDGFFGPNTATAASAEVSANGDPFTEIFPDDGGILPGAFERLGIACP